MFSESLSFSLFLFLFLDFCFILKFFFYFIYLFLGALGFFCCTQAFSSCGEWGLLFVVVCLFLIVVVSLVVEHRP